MVFCEMSPRCELSIRRSSETTWVLGTMMICERSSKPSQKSIASWIDEEAGYVYSVRRMSDAEQELNSRQPELAEGKAGIEGKAESERVYSMGSSAACWRIGGAYFKVKSWCEGIDKEADIIAFAKQSVPSLPVPQVLCSWVDLSWHRSFLILATVKGRTLAEAWPSLTEAQCQQVASKVASFCEDLASKTSPKLQNSSEGGVLEPFLAHKRDFATPSWIPHILGPLSPTELHSCLAKEITDSQVEVGETFHFYHADLGPTNIIVSDDGEIAGIIDWESAGFYPRFWIGTKPLVSAGFYLSPGQDWVKRKAWSVLLADALQRRGFEPQMHLFTSWKKAFG